MTVYQSSLIIASAIAFEGGWNRLSRSMLRLSGHLPAKKKRRKPDLKFRERGALLRSVIHDDWLE
jgi:hypothetical protein